MTMCNMTIEGGGRAGMIAPDETTFEYVKGRPGAPADSMPRSPSGASSRPTRARSSTRGRHRRLVAVADDHLGDEPGHGHRGRLRGARSRRRRGSGRRRDRGARAELHGARARHADDRDRLDRVFIGSCTNSRIEDLRAAARSSRGARSPTTVRAMVVPGLRAGPQAGRGGGPRRGLPRRRLRMACVRLFDVPGNEPRHPDRGRALRFDVEPQLRGPPGQGRAHPPRQPRMAAAAAIEGHFVDIRDWHQPSDDGGNA